MFIDYIWFQVMTKHLNGIFYLNMFSTVILPSQLDDILLMAKVIPPLYPLLLHPSSPLSLQLFFFHYSS